MHLISPELALRELLEGRGNKCFGSTILAVLPVLDLPPNPPKGRAFLRGTFLASGEFLSPASPSLPNEPPINPGENRRGSKKGMAVVEGAEGRKPSQSLVGDWIGVQDSTIPNVVICI